MFRMIAVLYLIELVLFSNASLAAKENRVTLAKVEKGKTLYVLNQNEAKAKGIYQAQENKGLCNISVSPSGLYVTALSRSQGKISGNKSIQELQEIFKSKLIVLSNTGQEVETYPDDIKQYVWSPESNEIACVIGKWLENSYNSFYPEEIQIKKIGSKQIIKINRRARDIYWSKYDNKLYYITDEGIAYRYSSGKEEMLTAKGIYFSPNEKYYYGRGVGEWNGYTDQIYKAIDNANETEDIWRIVENKYKMKIGKFGHNAWIKKWSDEGGAKLIIEVWKHNLSEPSEHGVIRWLDVAWKKAIIIDMQNKKIIEEIDDVNKEPWYRDWASNTGGVIQVIRGQYRVSVQ